MTRGWRRVDWVRWFGIFLAGVGSCVPHTPATRLLDVGDPVPIVGVPDSGLALVWVFRKESCLGCDLGSSASRLALLSRRFDDRVEVTAVAVGAETEADRKLVEGFLQSRRVAATIVLVDARSYASLFGLSPIPSLYLVHQGQIQVVVDLTDAELMDSGFARIGNQLEADPLLQPRQ